VCVELTSTALAGVRCTCLHYTAVWALHNACAALPCELHLPSANAALEYAALACAALSSLQVCVSCVCLRRAGVELCLHMHMHCAGVRHACHTAALGWATGHLRALQMPALHSTGVCDTPATAVEVGRRGRRGRGRGRRGRRGRRRGRRQRTTLEKGDWKGIF